MELGREKVPTLGMSVSSSKTNGYFLPVYADDIKKFWKEADNGFYVEDIEEKR